MFIVLDLETTGLSHREDSIIEVACIKIDRKTFIEVWRFTTFINPQKDIPELISSITHIFQKDVQDAPVFSEIKNELQDFLEWCPIIGHNIQFDLRFLEYYGVDISKNPPIDTFFLANFLCYDLKSLNLWYLCEHFSIELENAHRALDDVLATSKLFQSLIEILSNLPIEQKKVVSYYFGYSQEVGIRLLRDLYLHFPNQDLLKGENISEIYLSALEKNIYDIEDISHTHTTIIADDFLSKIPNFELRENQKQMLDIVDKTFSKWTKTIVEAPTGIGKTFAYLLPAITFSLRSGQPVHISTSTKALQDQIYYKDLHTIRSYFPEKFSYTKLKWKRNYLSVKAFLEFSDISQYVPASHISFLLKIFLWSMKTEFWELDDLDFYGEEYVLLWDIHAGNSHIFDESNIYKHVEFAVRARKRAKSSNIVITNNHILFQDIVSEGSLLGGVQNLVLDEAHTLEDVVTQSLKKTLSFQFLQSSLQKLDKKMLKYQIDMSPIMMVKQQLLYDTAELFSLFEGYIFEKFSSHEKYKICLLEGTFFQTYPSIGLLADKIISSFSVLESFIEKVQEEKSTVFITELQELSSLHFIFTEVFLHTNFAQNIYFLSYDDQKGTQLSTTLLEPWVFLKEQLWSRIESVVLTSATLQMGDDFSYIQKILHVEDFETYSLPSDFDYEKQALIFIPQDLGSIKNNSWEIIHFLNLFFQAVWGRTLVLFTAFFMIREVFSRLKIPLEQKNIYLYAQSVGGSKMKQIESFKKHPETSILLGTDTFWEGIDIPWEDLQYLVVHKIPFQVPTDPIFIARSKLYEDSFTQYAIPKSILKLKQGFWRLIRTKQDTGVIVFLDDRIYTTQWGKRYLEAFPKDIKVRYGSTQKLLEILQNKE